MGQATLAEFHEKTQSDLSVVTADTYGQEMLVLNHHTAPKCPLAWAVRMSMSIPFVWQEVRWQAEWGRYRNKDITGHTIVDGGTLSNFPIYLVASSDPEVMKVMGGTDPNTVPNLGLLIDETLEVEGAPPRETPKGTNEIKGELLDHVSHLRTIGRIRQLIDTITTAYDRNAIEAHKEEICRLPAKGYGTTEFDMSDARRDALINAGQKAMKEYLKTFG